MSIGMKTIEFAVIECDECTATEGDVYDDYDEDDVKDYAEGRGWTTLSDEIHLCDKCTKDPAKYAKHYKAATNENLPEPTGMEQAIAMHHWVEQQQKKMAG